MPINPRSADEMHRHLLHIVMFCSSLARGRSSDTTHSDVTEEDRSGSNMVPAPNESSTVTFTAVLTLLVLLCATTFIFFRSKRSQKPRSAILILGQCNAGKTSLFFLLRNQIENMPLVSSIKVLRDRIAISEEGGPSDKDTVSRKTVEIIECPGHARMRDVGFTALGEARAIVYMVDGTDKAGIKDASEHLYDIFTHRMLQPGTPMLLCINKLDKMTRGERMITDEIEREIERMRYSRACSLEGQDAADNYLGIDGERFKLAHAPCNIDVCSISVTAKRVARVYEFLAQQVF